ncbi:MAG TPA: hypothetical protein VF773_22070 [Verrucomicrobiae bacterium]
MSLLNSTSNRIRKALCFALQLATGALALHAATITNVNVVNVTPSSFSLVWRTAQSSVSEVQVFADAGGQSNITSVLGVEFYPLHTGNPNFLEGYERRQSRVDLHEKTKSLGLVHAKVRNGHPGATYYYKILSSSGGTTNTFPAIGTAAVQLPQENSFVLNSQQLIIDMPGVDHSGQIVTLSHTNGAYALAAVVGDGTSTNQVFFNLNDIFAMSGGNLSPVGGQEFLVTIHGPANTQEQQVFNVAFTDGFSVGGANEVSTADDFLVVGVGSGIYRTGVTNELAIELNSSGLLDFSLNISLPDGRFDKLALKSARPQIDSSSLSIVKSSVTNYTLSFRAATGNLISGDGPAVLLSFVSTNHTSAFVPVRASSIVARKADASSLVPLLVTSGRMVLVGNEPLVEATIASTGRHLALYGKPGSSYEIQGASNLDSGSQWNLVARVPMTSLVYEMENLNNNERTKFFRALEFTADPPLLEIASTRSNESDFRIFGRPGTAYNIQYTTNLSGIVQWHPLLNYTLTNSFGNVAGVPTTNGNRFFRLSR